MMSSSRYILKSPQPPFFKGGEELGNTLTRGEGNVHCRNVNAIASADFLTLVGDRSPKDDIIRPRSFSYLSINSVFFSAVY